MRKNRGGGAFEVLLRGPNNERAGSLGPYEGPRAAELAASDAARLRKQAAAGVTVEVVPTGGGASKRSSTSRSGPVHNPGGRGRQGVRQAVRELDQALSNPYLPAYSVSGYPTQSPSGRGGSFPQIGNPRSQWRRGDRLLFTPASADRNGAGEVTVLYESPTEPGEEALYMVRTRLHGQQLARASELARANTRRRR